jgi:hypothetical protein
VTRLLALVLAAAALAAATAQNGNAALFFLFDPALAKPGDRVTVRTGGTPENFALRNRVKPFLRPIRLYLVQHSLAGRIASRFDSRLSYVGSIVRDRRGRGVLTFTVPPVGTDDYAVASWCPSCAAYSRRTFHVQRADGNVVPRYRPFMKLRVDAPSASDTCPVTIPNRSRPLGERIPQHGNGALWAALPADGVFEFERSRIGADGTVGTKQIWWAAGTSPWADLAVLVERFDGVGPKVSAQTVRGWPQNSGFRGSGSWAARLRFPSEGCWKVTGRVRDVSLAFVVEVVVR